KKDIIHNEYNVPMSKELDKEVDLMCDISSLYIERGLQQGLQQGLQKGFDLGVKQGREQGIMKEKISTIVELSKIGVSLENIARATHISSKEVLDILNTNK
ncbi:MAG: hypothetical protein K6C13_16715, partial [Oscillospiraceae bacterium]|nr:hypothetical protein [Oscillospiraceae bacterium]